MQGHTAHQLDVEGPLAEDPPGALSDHGKGLDKEVVEVLPLVEAFFELDGLVPKGVVVERLDLLLERVDHGDQLGEATHLLTLAGLEDLCQHTHFPAILPASNREKGAYPEGLERAACG